MEIAEVEKGGRRRGEGGCIASFAPCPLLIVADIITRSTAAIIHNVSKNFGHFLQMSREEEDEEDDEKKRERKGKRGKDRRSRAGMAEGHLLLSNLCWIVVSTYVRQNERVKMRPKMAHGFIEYICLLQSDLTALLLSLMKLTLYFTIRECFKQWINSLHIPFNQPIFQFSK
ncbi:SsrA-binding protein [Dirofilaria immitis]